MSDVQPAVVHPDRLRLARLGRRFRQRDVSTSVGVAPQRISDFEQGLRHPTPEQTAALTRLLGPQILIHGSEAD
jgi:transcriptional regulator with XRE-family HTH domain